MSSPASAQRVPAWKRLGLKLKSGASDDQPAPPPSSASPLNPPKPRDSVAAGPTNGKRKPSGAPADQTPSKKAKSVSFADQPGESRPATALATTNTSNGGEKVKPPRDKPKQKQATKPKQSPKKAGASQQQPGKQGAVNLEPALQYLRQWKSSKDTWKFNKNHQTRLLEQLFASETTVPAVDINTLYEYIRGLKGGVRQRLRELANGVKAQDMEQGAAGFSPSSNSKPSAAATQKQSEYEDAIAAFMRGERTTEKRRFEEVEYVLRTADMEMQRRVVKRMRAETVLDELSDSDEETDDTTNNNNNTAPADEADGEEAATAKRLSLSDGSQQRVKRRKKTRTAVIEDDSSSSDSSSDSDSDSSSSSSSSDDSDSDDEDEAAKGGLAAGDAAAADTSSSSSSSSSSSEGEESSSEEESSDSSEEDDRD